MGGAAAWLAAWVWRHFGRGPAPSTPSRGSVPPRRAAECRAAEVEEEEEQ